MSNRFPRLATKLSASMLLVATAACTDNPTRVVAPDAAIRQDLSGIPSTANTILKVTATSPGFIYEFTGAEFFIGGFQATGAGTIGTFEVYCINVMNSTPPVGTDFTVRSLSIEDAVQPANLPALQRVLGGTIDATAMKKKLRQSAYLAGQFSATPSSSWDEIQAAIWKLYSLPAFAPAALGTSNPTLEAQFVSDASDWADNAANSADTWRVVVDARAWDPNVTASSLAQIFVTRNNPAALGNRVWHDLNANGVQDAGEPGIAGATVTATGPNGALTPILTDANGNYLFSDLPAGSYTVCVALPTGYSDVSPSAQGGNGALDSDGSGTNNCATVTLAAGQTNLDVDFGFFKRAAVGDLVWYDQNGNGVQDAGEPGIAGATVTITGPNGFSSSMLTNSNGGYSFANLLPGTYTICVATPAGYTGPTSAGQGGDATKDSNGSGSPNCATVTLTSGQTDNTIDFGFVLVTGTIGNYTWIDANGNGRQDAGEPALNGVQLQLTGTSAATQTSANGGQYLFTSLVAGGYTVRATAPAGFTFTTANSPLATNGTDSNGNPTTVTLAAGENNLTIDFGFVPLPGSGQGCTPGFWKQSQKFGNWKWYTRTDMVDAVFGVTFRSTARNNPTGALTLLEALELNGNGGAEQIFRHGTAALLNAVYQSGVSYPFTASQVITMVRTAWLSGDAALIESTHRQLSAANERGCPLN